MWRLWEDLPDGDGGDPRLREADVLALGELAIIYMAGLVFRPKTEHARLGVDSIAVLVVYLTAIGGLAILPS